MTFTIQKSRLQDIWNLVIKEIMEKGETYIDQRGTKVKELLNVIWTVQHPLESEIPKGNPMGINSVEAYKNQLLDPDRGGFAYTYGNRLNQYTVFKPVEEPQSNISDIEEFKELKLEGAYLLVNQIKKIIIDLIAYPETRRATMVTWQLPDDLLNEEVPCLIMIDYKIRGGKLFTSAIWRSHDYFSAAVPNFFALLELSKYIAKRVELPVGPITIQSISAHIYEYDWESAKEVFTNKVWDGVQMTKNSTINSFNGYEKLYSFS
ncbi:MAG: thymidylate synthase [Candidatus Methanofastidiosa archaeon]|nr:thymidylate synthase [Candidatus Methanofastidiosa archaeon]